MVTEYILRPRNVGGFRFALGEPAVVAVLVARLLLLRRRVRRPGVLPTKGRRTTRRLRGLNIQAFYEAEGASRTNAARAATPT